MDSYEVGIDDNPRLQNAPSPSAHIVERGVSRERAQEVFDALMAERKANGWWTRQVFLRPVADEVLAYGSPFD